MSESDDGAGGGARSGQLFRLAAPVEHEIEVKRSRFIADLTPVDDEGQARAEIARIRRAHSKARHHCTAFLLAAGPAGSDRPEVARTNDDGEPSGTAGAPMLAALHAAAVRDVVAVVTRYFGGVLLGTGGLARAYGGAVTEALALARLTPIIHRVLLEVEADYPDAAIVEALARSQGWEIAGADYAARVNLRLAVLPDQAGAVRAQIAGATSGRVEPTPGGTAQG